MSRRRPVGKKIYSISYLLDKQPKSLKRNKKWPLMISYLNSEPKLLQLRFNRRCYSLLNNAVIQPENLKYFYRTYRLPQNPFFPLFFLIKREYFNNREMKKRERDQYITEGLTLLPPYVTKAFSEAASIEKTASERGSCPIYNKEFLPKSKKRIDQYKCFSHKDWVLFFDSYLTILRNHYSRVPESKLERLRSLFILMITSTEEIGIPTMDEINGLYRNLCKTYHPDLGGDPQVFIKLKWAKDHLEKRHQL